ncbi:hypothetical protein ACIXSW_02500 [Bacteroides fragilis]
MGETRLSGARSNRLEGLESQGNGWKATGLETPEGRDTKKKEEASRASSSMAF